VDRSDHGLNLHQAQRAIPNAADNFARRPRHKSSSAAGRLAYHLRKSKDSSRDL
jgi:hypothetical protein